MRLRVKGYIYIGSNTTGDNLTSGSFIWRVFSRYHALKASRIFSITHRISKTIHFPPAALLCARLRRAIASARSNRVEVSYVIESHVVTRAHVPSLMRTVPNYQQAERASVAPHTARRNGAGRSICWRGTGEIAIHVPLGDTLFLSLSRSLYIRRISVSQPARETSRDSRTNRVFLGRANSPSCATWLVVARIPVNNARDSPSGYFPGINYAEQEFMRRSDR